MGMSMHVKGLGDAKHPDFVKHAAVMNACAAAGVKTLPEETAAFFGASHVDPYLIEERLEVKIPAVEWNDDHGCSNGFEVEVKDIPADVHTIRFYASY